MKLSRILYSIVLAGTFGIGTVHAQRSVAGHTLVLDDNASHKITVQTPTGMSGDATVTLQTNGGTVPPSGTADGQMARWNNATQQWEISPSLLNVGNNLTSNGYFQSTLPLGTGSP